MPSPLLLLARLQVLEQLMGASGVEVSTDKVVVRGMQCTLHSCNVDQRWIVIA